MNSTSNGVDPDHVEWARRTLSLLKPQAYLGMPNGMYLIDKDKREMRLTDGEPDQLHEMHIKVFGELGYTVVDGRPGAVN